MDSSTTEAFVEKPAVDSAFALVSFVVEIIRHYLLSIVILVGIVANIISIIVFIRCRHKDRASIVYLTLLSFSDLGNLVIYTIFYWLEDGLKYITNGEFYIALRETSHYGCKMLRYVLDICRFLSAWLIVAFSVERTICVWFPLKSLQILTRRNRIWTATTLVVLAFVTNIRVLTHFGLIERYVGKKFEITCFYDESESSQFEIHLASFGNLTLKNYLLPCILIVALNILIILGIRRTRNNKFIKRPAAQDMKATINLLVISSLYFVLNMPYVVIWSIVEFHPLHYSVIGYYYTLGHFSTCLTVISYCSNLPIYCKSLDYFRRELEAMFCCCAERAKNAANETVASQMSASRTNE